MEIRWLIVLLVAAAGCDPCDAQSFCGSLNGYAAYDANGKLAPSTMCGAKAMNGGTLGNGQCGMSFSWKTIAGICSCDAVEPCLGFQSYTWNNCQFTADSGGGGSGGGAGGGGGSAVADGGGGAGGGGGGGAGGGGGGGAVAVAVAVLPRFPAAALSATAVLDLRS